MDLPELKSGEKGLIKSPNVQVKSVPFNAFLTSERVILMSAGDTDIPQKDIPLDTIESAEPDESEKGEPLVAITVFSQKGEIKRMNISFVQDEGKSRKEERDKWVLKITERKVLAQAWEKESEAKEKKAKDPFAKPNFHDGIHAQKPRGNGKTQRGDLKFITNEMIRGGKREPISFRDNGVTNRDLTGEPSPRQEAGLPEEEIRRTPGPLVTNEPGAADTAGRVAEMPEMPEERPSPPALSTAGWFFCNRCGNRVPPGSVFCNRCGGKVAAPGETPAPVFPVHTPAPPAAEPFDIRTFPVEPIRKEPLIPVPVVKPARPKKGLLPGISFPTLFRKRPKKAKARSPAPDLPPPGKPSGGRRFAPSRRILLGGVAVAVIFVVALAGVMYGGTVLKMIPAVPALPGDNGTATATTAATGSPTPTATSTGQQSPRTTISPGSTPVPTRTPVVVPTAGIFIRVDYIGSWSGIYGTAAEILKVKNSGERLYEIENPNGTVFAGFKKLDGSAHPLTVEIYKNGQVIKTGTSSDSDAVVNITADS